MRLEHEMDGFITGVDAGVNYTKREKTKAS